MSGLERLLRPRSIAVIGGGVWCENVISECRKMGFSGDIWPVHPTRPEIGGLAAVKDVGALPASPDAAFVGVNRNATIDMVAGLAALNAGGAVCFASGFREAGADHLQQALFEAAGDVRILGPNCYGFINYLDGALLWPDQHGGRRVGRGVALITQSSNIALNLTMQRRGLPLAYVVTAGNQAQTGLSEIGAALLSDERVTALGLHIEGIDDLRGFEALASEAARRGKPIVALKVGRSAEAQAATVSHTASLAGGDAGAKALFERLGIGQVHCLADMIETLKILHLSGPLKSRRIASMSCSGGEASLIADLADSAGLTFPPLDKSQRDRLKPTLGPLVNITNPLDYHTDIWGNVDALADTFSTMASGNVGAAVIILDYPRADRCDDEAWRPVEGAAATARKDTKTPIAIVSTLSENMSEATAERLMADGIIPLCGLREAVSALAIAALPEPAIAEPILLPCPPAAPTAMAEADAKAALSAFGLETPKGVRASDANSVAEASAGLCFPVALKGEGFEHKSEVGAVRLGLNSRAALLDAAAGMPCERFLIEEMIAGGVGELLIGVICDPAHGYVLSLAAGGTLAELLVDRVSLLLPATETQIGRALANLKAMRLLEGYRGGPTADIAAIITAITAVQNYVIAHQGKVQEVEINPLICCADRAVAADALIVSEGMK